MAFALTLIIGVLLIAGLSYVFLLLFFFSTGTLLLLMPAVCIGLNVLSVRLRHRIPTKAVILTECVSMAIGYIACRIIAYLENIHYWPGEIGGLTEALWAITMITFSFLLLLSTGISLLIVRRRKNKSAALDNSAQT